MELKPGTWITMRYGHERNLFWVGNIHSDEIEVCQYSWLSTHTTWIPVFDGDRSYQSIKIIGQGKLRWWWRCLPPFIREAFCPFTRAKTEFTND